GSALHHRFVRQDRLPGRARAVLLFTVGDGTVACDVVDGRGTTKAEGARAERRRPQSVTRIRIRQRRSLMNAKKKGSTLVELLAVLVISSIFLALLAPAVYNIATNAPPTAARKVFASSADPTESPGDEATVAGPSHGAGRVNPRNP